jgi:pyruvate carboxylase subunit B
MFGPWKQIAPGYGKMVLGYFGKTPVEPDSEIVKLASEKLKMEPTTQNPLDIADADPRKSVAAWKERLEIEGLETTEENIFIAAACDEKGITFLKGEGPLNVRKIDTCENVTCETKPKEEKKEVNKMADGIYTVIVDGKKFSVQVAEGNADIQAVTPVAAQAPAAQAPATQAPAAGGTEIGASVNGNVWKILVNVGDKVEKGQVVAILEAMKMEIDIESPASGTISAIAVKPNDAVEEGQTIAVIS